MIQRLAKVLRLTVKDGASAERLACTIALGAYVAFSPFIGFHTIMVILFSGVFNLSLPLMLVVSNCINNPWTFIPIYAGGYACGNWILEVMQIQSGFDTNPAWMAYINTFLVQTLGFSEVSLLTFIVGGNVLGVLIALCVYPLAKISIIRARLLPQAC